MMSHDLTPCFVCACVCVCFVCVCVWVCVCVCVCLCALCALIRRLVITFYMLGQQSLLRY